MKDNDFAKQKMLFDDIKVRVADALNVLCDKDADLLYRNANERSITHKLAVYLQCLFPSWDVDLEYNRKGDDPKRINGHKVYPDIIIHKRGRNDNLLAIEVKKSTSTENKENDEHKLKKLTSSDKYKYEYGLLLTIDVTENGKHIQQWFTEGKKINNISETSD